MPRGGRRPGAGARKGNTNAVKQGGGSQRAQELLLALQTHPNRYEILLIALEAGAFDYPVDLRTFNLARFVAIMHPAVFDPEHPQFARINAPPPHWRPGQSRKALPPLIVFTADDQKPSNTVKDSQTLEARASAETQPPDSASKEPHENESPSNTTLTAATRRPSGGNQ